MCNNSLESDWCDLADVGRIPRAVFFERAGVRYGARRWELLPGLASDVRVRTDDAGLCVASPSVAGRDPASPVMRGDSGSCAPRTAAGPADAYASSPCSLTPIVLLHGFSQSGHTWDEIAPQFAARWPGRAIWALDFVGHGLSDVPADPAPYAFDELVATLAAFIDEVVLPDDAPASAASAPAAVAVSVVGHASVPAAAPAPKPASRIALVGYSMGGRVALAYAAAHPERLASLVLESAGLGPADKVARSVAAQRDAALAARVRSESLADFMDFWETRPVFASQLNLPERQRGRLRAARMDNDPGALALTFEGSGQHTMPNLAQVPSQLAARGIPVLYLAGELDAKYAALAESLTSHGGSEMAPIVRILSGVGHDIHFEDPACYVEELFSFLSEER